MSKVGILCHHVALLHAIGLLWAGLCTYLSTWLRTRLWAGLWARLRIGDVSCIHYFASCWLAVNC